MHTYMYIYVFFFNFHLLLQQQIRSFSACLKGISLMLHCINYICMIYGEREREGKRERERGRKKIVN